MKKLIPLTLVCLLVCGCDNESAKETGTDERSKIDRYTVIVIDSCEYIAYGHALTHKGNCKYCTDRKNHYRNEK